MPLFLVKRHITPISAGLTQLVQRLEEPLDEGNTLFARTVFFQEQVTEALFEAIDFVQHGKLLKIGFQLGLLLRGEVVAMASHQRQ